MKKLVSLMLALVMMVGMVVPAYADNGKDNSVAKQDKEVVKNSNFEIMQVSDAKFKIVDKDNSEQEYFESIQKENGEKQYFVTNKKGQKIMLKNRGWTTTFIEKTKNTDLVDDLDLLISILIIPLDDVTGNAISIVKDVAKYCILHNMDVVYYTVEYQYKYDGEYLCKRRIYQYYKNNTYTNSAKIGSEITSSITYVGIGVYSTKEKQ